MPLDQGAGVAPVLRPSIWSLDWETPGGGDEDDGDHEDEMLVLKAADGTPSRRSLPARRFPDGPTEPQAQGWPLIARGLDTLIAAPTGSGKTLAGFGP